MTPAVVWYDMILSMTHNTKSMKQLIDVKPNFKNFQGLLSYSIITICYTFTFVILCFLRSEILSYYARTEAVQFCNCKQKCHSQGR